MTANPDAKLLRLEAEFNAASDRWNAATDRTEALEEELEATISRLRSRLAKAEKKEEKKSQAFARALDRIIKTRAKSLEGLLVKVRVRERDYTDDEDLEVEILKSLVDDIKAMSSRA
jgi:predicted  nucleic acid-binding Zn-ribbon protein